MNRLLLLAWKEVIDYLRDTRTLVLMALSAMVLPLLGILVMGLQSQQKIVAVVAVCDEGAWAEKLARMVEKELASHGVKVVRVNTCKPLPGVELGLLIPRGFSDNVTRLGSPVVVRVYALVGSTGAARARSILDIVLHRFSEEVARARVAILAEKAGVKVDADLVLHPLRVLEEQVTVTGQPAPPSLAVRASMARFLAFAVFFVLNPATISLADAFAGERERRTAEMLAASPLRPIELVLGKIAGSLVVAAVAAALDAMGVIAYLLVLGLQGLVVGLELDLALFHAFSTLVAVLASAGLAAPIAVIAPTPRAATIGASVVTAAATAVFFSALFIDFNRLPLLIQAVLNVVPYTHVAMAITSYALGEKLLPFIHLLVALAMTGGGVIVAAKLYDPERFVRV